MRQLNWGNALGLLNVTAGTTLALDYVASVGALPALLWQQLACMCNVWAFGGMLSSLRDRLADAADTCSSGCSPALHLSAAVPPVPLTPLLRCPAAAPGNRTLGVEQLPVEIKGSSVWPTVIGDNAHKAVLANGTMQLDIAKCNPSFVQVRLRAVDGWVACWPPRWGAFSCCMHRLRS